MYDQKAIEAKYQQIWRDTKVYEPDLENAAKPYYNLMMFPYPSAEGLHVGNMYAFTGADAHGRFRRMQGYDVFEPIGLDGFGIHSENYAIKVGRHPKEQAEISEPNFYRQLSQIGNGFAWEEKLETYDPAYYRWTQWLFIQMFKRGLAYKGTARVNWCPNCKTVLADEQVEDSRCERCQTEVERREMSSWYFQITKYADRLLQNIDNYAWTDLDGRPQTGLNWPNKVTSAQKRWIGRKDGLAINFPLVDQNTNDNSPDSTTSTTTNITVWTTYWETIFGATYLVVAPEYADLQQLIEPDQQATVDQYVQQALNKSEQERQVARQKTGVFTGSYAKNPATNQQIPIWVADYVLTDVGTGAVMGVPAHDQRDFDFAKQYDLPIVQVVEYADAEINAKVAQAQQAYEGEGRLINSSQFDGQSAWGDGKEAIKNWLTQLDLAQDQRTYHLRDWLISRQRYWGPPIPLMYCEDCAQAGRGERTDLPGWYTVPEEDLPLELPHLDEFKPTGDGTSPLDNAPPAWKFATCPACGGKAKRETDVSDTFLDSSWYFLRYPSVGANQSQTKAISQNPSVQDQPTHDQPTEQTSANISSQNQNPWPRLDPSGQNKPNWFPVDIYVGGAEHAVLHLLYARFVTMALCDWGLVPSEEPFPYFFGHGLLIKDGAKMSKSKGNVINPDDYIAKYGADALRSYLMFLGAYDQGGDFRDTGMHGMAKWLNRVWDIVQTVKNQAEASADGANDPSNSPTTSELNSPTTPELKRQLHRTIEANTREMAQLKFNTCLARLMEVVNVWREVGQNMNVPDTIAFLQLLAPFAPHLTEELYQQLLPLAHPEQNQAERNLAEQNQAEQNQAEKNQTEQNQGQEQTQFNSIHRSTWPTADPEQLIQDSVTVAVQVNGKLRATLEIPSDQINDQDRIIAQARELAEVQRHCQGREIKKSIYVPGKVVNLVV
mgnify:CR=1 FL=1